ncbi:hypothetical protein [Antiquaquibacter soli]|uniref:Uncharacterized protein n=1 Tax=Antiquaquibacter soli TaxID=3064523 RepID=A0ABT9BSI0_9MICO|nr:hypothetical protein [Protaetiibacter sp. WY-16]MDO7882746.1 hypothetical protein [Protaetiibacter sp. WY-16]
MDSLESITVTAFDTHWEARFGLHYDILRSGDSLVFGLETESGSRELTVRVERGRVVDVAVWDAQRTRRVALPFESAVLGARELVCVVPASLLAPERARARVMLNGALAGLASVQWARDDSASDHDERVLASA